MLRSLSGRFLFLTIIFVFLAEILIFVPSVARFREDYLLLRLERAQIASLALLADDMLEPALESELLRSAGVYNVVLRRDDMRQLALSSPLPAPVSAHYDLRNVGAWQLITDALSRLIRRENVVIRVIGAPVQQGGDQIEVTMDSAPLRAAMLDYGIRIAQLSLVISVITASLLFLAVRVLMVKPIRRVVRAMRLYAADPEDARRQVAPSSQLRELRDAEEALHSLQARLTAALKQRERLALLGTGVSKISHDLRNILTSAQLFSDRLEGSDDPTVQRLAPRLLRSISRAVTLCESTLAFGRVDEAAPQLQRFDLAAVVADVFAGEELAAQDHQVTFEAQIPQAFSMRADPEQLHRVIDNLVRNARVAIMASGEAGDITVQACHDGDDCVIEIHDTGPGLPPAVQTHLFEPFHSGSGQGGNGLGLTIAAELVRGHGGTLELTSTGAEGSRFAIRLPQGDLGQGLSAEKDAG